MNRHCQLSHVTEDYLAAFYCILDEMIEKMTQASLCDSISHNFITQMLPHHRAAIRMSENILKYTTFVPLQNIAQNIISEQTKSIEDMKGILCQCEKCCNSECDLQAYTQRTCHIMHTMFTNMHNSCATNNLNASFMREMIPHHMGAVEMSENARRFCICPGLVPVIDAIIVSQKKGIRQMQQLLRCICRCC